MTDTTMTAVAKQEPTLAQEIGARVKQFNAALPAHIPAERFARVVLTAVQRNPELRTADRQSLWNAALQAAQDGLLPDAREGAFVIYNTKVKNEVGKEIWISKVQWMVMIAGLRKKVRNSGEMRDWNAQVVYAKDEFDFQLGDDPFLRHKPFMPKSSPEREDGEDDEQYSARVQRAMDPGPVIAAYSIAIFKTGEKSREVMTRAQIEKVRRASKKAESGPWVHWFEEMARKTVARRHSKTLPLSSDLDDLIRRDDQLYDLAGARDDHQARLVGKPQNLSSELDRLAGDVDDRSPPHDRETGEVIDDKPKMEESEAAPNEEVVQDAGNAVDEAEPKAGKRANADKTESGELRNMIQMGGEAAERGSGVLRVFLRSVNEKNSKTTAFQLFGKARIDNWYLRAGQIDDENDKK